MVKTKIVIDPSPNWGGKREGAGRKALGDKKRVTIGLTVEASTKEKLQKLAKEQGISMSELINRLAKTL